MKRHIRQLYEQYADLLYGYGMKIAGDDTLVNRGDTVVVCYIFEKRETCAAPQSITRLLVCFVETHDSERTEKRE